MDQALINELMGESCNRIQSMAKDGRCCTYRVAGPVELEFSLHEFKGAMCLLPILTLQH